MPKLKRLSGRDVLAIFVEFGFESFSQRGSHIKLRRTLPDGTTQTLIVPAHAKIDTGTSAAIYRQALGYIPASELRKYFYSA